MFSYDSNLTIHRTFPKTQEKKYFALLPGVNLYTLEIYAYDNGLQESGYALFSGNRPGIAFLCHTTSQESPAARSGSEAPEKGLPVLWDRVVQAAMAPQHPCTAHATAYRPGGWAGSQRCCSYLPAK